MKLWNILTSPWRTGDERRGEWQDKSHFLPYKQVFRLDKYRGQGTVEGNKGERQQENFFLLEKLPSC